MKQTQNWPITNNSPSKIQKIRESFRGDIDRAFIYDEPFVKTPHENLKIVAEEQIVIFVLQLLRNKSCKIDPMSTSLIKQYASILSPVLARIVNLSLFSSILPSIYKIVVVKPLLKSQH